MSKKKSRSRNYSRLLHNRNSIEFNRDNHELLLTRSIRSNDIYDRDFYFVASNSTDIYAKQLSDERWKEFSIVNDDYIVSPVDSSDMMKILEFERSIKLLIELEDSEFLKVVVFFSLIHNLYPKFSSELHEDLYEIKSHLILEIHNFQEGKLGMKRKSKITTSYQRFLITELEKTESHVKKLIRRYKKLVKSIFQN